jgi:hypothetical protein
MDKVQQFPRDLLLANLSDQGIAQYGFLIESNSYRIKKFLVKAGLSMP